MEGGIIEPIIEIINEEIINEINEYPEERKPALYLKFKNILFEKRNELLYESDKYMLIDYPISEGDRVKILTYRQKLRDYPQLSFFENFNGNYGEGVELLPKLSI
jgi:uncharacterized ubiquitin-like protein YukD